MSVLKSWSRLVLAAITAPFFLIGSLAQPAAADPTATWSGCSIEMLVASGYITDGDYVSAYGRFQWLDSCGKDNYVRICFDFKHQKNDGTWTAWSNAYIGSTSALNNGCANVNGWGWPAGEQHTSYSTIGGYWPHANHCSDFKSLRVRSAAMIWEDDGDHSAWIRSPYERTFHC